MNEHAAFEAGGELAKSILPRLKAAAETNPAPVFFWAGFLSGIYAYAAASVGAGNLREMASLIQMVAEEEIGAREVKQ